MILALELVMILWHLIASILLLLVVIANRLIDESRFELVVDILIRLLNLVIFNGLYDDFFLVGVLVDPHVVILIKHVIKVEVLHGITTRRLVVKLFYIIPEWLLLAHFQLIVRRCFDVGLKDRHRGWYRCRCRHRYGLLLAGVQEFVQLSQYFIPVYLGHFGFVVNFVIVPGLGRF